MGMNLNTLVLHLNSISILGSVDLDKFNHYWQGPG